MGDRALVLFHDKNRQDFSPVVYLHWNGTEVPDLINKLKTLMGPRTDDVQYASARFVGICHEYIKGNLSLGIWNADKEITDFQNDIDPSSHSHGDAGIIYVDCSDFSWQAFGGYLEGFNND